MMDIQIPQADQDTGTESHPTDRTYSQITSDAWSLEGQASTLTSRSNAFSGVSQTHSSRVVATTDKRDTDACKGNDSKNFNDDFQRDEDTEIPLKSPGTDRDLEKSCSEDTYRSTRLAAEEATNKYLSAVSSDSQDGEAESSRTMEANEEKDSTVVDSEAKTAEMESEQNIENTGAESEMVEEEPINTDVNEDEACSNGPNEETTDANKENTVDNNQDSTENAIEDTMHNENGSNISDNHNNNEESERDSETADHNSGSGSMADAEETETPRNAQDSQQTQDNNETKAEDCRTSQEQEGDKQKPVFLTENDQQEEQEAGSDISGVRADTPNWEEEGAENDAASLSDVGGISQRPARSSAHSRLRPLTRSTMHEDVAPGQRAVVNTPVSYLTATDFNTEVVRNLESRNTSHAAHETVREAAFQHAMTLMTSRCDSKDGSMDPGGVYNSMMDASYGPKYPQYFYVQQYKPVPMAPLKAWRGYHGNVYFEPMSINRVGGGKGAESMTDGYSTRKATPTQASCKSAGSRRTRTMTPASKSRALVPVNTEEEGSVVTAGEGQGPTHSTASQSIKRGAMSAKSRASSRSVAAISQHHVLYLDKQAVIRPDNSAMHEELDVIEKQQATGSLNIHTRRHFPEELRAKVGRSGASSAKFDRICRGSVANKLRRAKSSGPLGSSSTRSILQHQQQQQRLRNQRTADTAAESKNISQLIIVGDKFAPPAAMSPLLRTQTQFSLSSQRMTVNSPDLYGAFDRLPPLEQVRISLRQMDASGDESLAGRVSTPYSTGSNVGVVEELKPFIKYSPDVKAQYNRQLKFY